MTECLEELGRLQNQPEDVLLGRVGAFIREHPEANSSQFAVNVLLALAGRIGISHLGADRTAYYMEVVVASVRKHGGHEEVTH